MGITIKEIAQKANVSIGTVDRVLHNRGRFGSDTAKRIHEICREYNYVSNTVGKAMYMQRNENKVAVVINSKDRNDFSALIHEGLEEYARSVKDYNVVFEFHDMKGNSVEELSFILDNLCLSEYKGLIIKPIDDQAIRERLLRFLESNIPVITCTSDMKGINALSYVGQDHCKLGRMLACTLTRVAKEEQRILIVVGSLNSNARKSKLQGFVDYMEEHGRPYTIEDTIEVPYVGDKAYEFVKKEFEKHPDVNSVYFHVEDLEPCLNAINDQGRSKCLKYSYGHSRFMKPFIKDGRLDFAVYENPYEQGYTAGNTMFSYLLNGKIPENGKHILEGQIVFDENC